MYFQFSPAIQAGIEAGKYVQVYSNGVPIGQVRDAATGRWAGQAIAAVVNNSPLSPLVSPAQFAMSGLQMYQNHRGFTAVLNGLQTIQTSLGVLQATTALIGVGTVAAVALSAVNFHQTLKLREDVKQLRLEVKDGFIDLRQALKDQGAEIIKRIEEVAQDVEYRHHRTILVVAYGRFTQALICLRDALKLTDVNHRNAGITSARNMLYEALADYNNPLLFEATNSTGQLRRRECAWAIDQAITTTYQLQGADEVVCDRLSLLQTKIRQDSLNIINGCKTEDELDFIFPEIARIHDHDLAVLNSWQNHVEWVRSLPPEDLKLLASSNFSSSDATGETTATLTAPPEQLIYENLKQKSHPQSLELQLKFMMSPHLRLEYESYVSGQAASVGYKALISSNLQQASNLAVANLYWYFKVREESKEGVVV